MLQNELVQLRNDLTYFIRYVEVLTRSQKQLRGKSIPLMEVLCEKLTLEEVTWELEEDLKKDYPDLFKAGKHPKFQGKKLFERGENITSPINIEMFVLIRFLIRPNSKLR